MKNEITKILYKYLTHESVKLVGMEKKIDDIQWLIRNGYVEDFNKDKRGFYTPGTTTAKGKQFFAEYEKELSILFKKTQNNLTEDNERRTIANIKSYIKEHRDLNFSIDSNVFNGLTDDEKYAFLYFAQNPLDSGRR